MATIAATLSSITAAASTDPASIVLRDGLDGPDFAAGGGLYYRENYEQTAGRVEFQSDVKRTGRGALKLSIKPLGGEAGNRHSERAEIWERTELRVPYDRGVWYGFAVKFGDTIPTDDHRYLIAQWKREIDPGAEGDFSPFLALRLRNGKLFATVETNYVAPGQGGMNGFPHHCGSGTVPVWFRPRSNQMRALVAADKSWRPEDGAQFGDCTQALKVIDHGNKLPSPGSGWIDFAVFTKPGPDGSGHVEIIANGKPIVTVRGHIGHADKGLGKNQYFKFGPYRSAHPSEWTLYYDDFRRSPNCSDVLGDVPCAAR